jgi:trk system potassium uptake protein TrkH
MESSDKSEKILPRVNQIAAGIVIAYVGLSALCAIAYFAAGMTMFEAVNHAMTTLATGGYSTHDSSMGYYADNRALLVISTIFMALAGLPFILFVKAVMPRRLRTLSDPQVTLFFAIIAIATVVLAAIQRVEFNTKPIDALVTSAFNFVSILTTTGYASEDYTRWGSAAIGVFLIAYFLGGCAGSTAGGIKMNRAVILWRTMRTSLTRLITPHAVVKTRYGRDEVSSEAAQTVLVFFFLFIATLVFGTMALMLLGHEFVTAFSSAITALSNVGPGLGPIVGPSGNFSSLDDPSLWIMSYLMLAGRLEIVTVVILMTPAFWSR